MSGAALVLPKARVIGGETKEVTMRRLPLAAALLLGSAPALAHHGWGSYDAAKPMTVKAVVEAVTLGNPHGMVMLTLDGKRWHVTLAPLSRMIRRGATEDIVVKGKEITAHGYPKRDGTLEMRAEWIEIDGKRYELR
jgi:hypothetical protein